MELGFSGNGKRVEKKSSQDANSEGIELEETVLTPDSTTATTPASPQWKDRAVKTALFIVFNAYLAYAIFWHTQNSESGDWQWCDGLGFVLICTGLVYARLVYVHMLQRLVLSSAPFERAVTRPLLRASEKLLSFRLARFIIYLSVLSSIVIFLVIDSSDDRRRLISASGVVVFVVLLALASTHPKRINWRQVTWSLSLQFLFALLILRWPLGKAVFDCIGRKINRFLGFTNEGSGFVFGYLVHQRIFNEAVFDNHSLVFNVTSEINAKKAVPGVVVFSALSVIYFFSFVVNILFHFGAVQWLTAKIGWLLSATVGTSSVESMNAASNIFIGQAMAPLLIQPYLSGLTVSEIHAVLTSGFATIAGTVMAAYISFGVNPAHLLSASVMSAPAALAAAKLLLPETEAKKKNEEVVVISSAVGNGESSSLLNAATEGAASAANLVLNITAIVVAFIAFVAFLNALVAFFGGLIGFPDVNFEILLGYGFMPLAFIMGVDWSECHLVGTLIGIKTVANEFIAYRRLGLLIQEGLLSPRASIICTYALCGYANPGSVGIQLACFTSLCPERRKDVSSVIGRAFVAGSFACFFTACFAGALLSATEDQI